jgi:hypothetical protein
MSPNNANRNRQPYQDGFCRLAPQRCQDQWKVLHATPRARLLLSIGVDRGKWTAAYPGSSRYSLPVSRGQEVTIQPCIANSLAPAY